MGDQFKPGEIAILQNVVFPLISFLNGTECEVVEVFDEPHVWHGITYLYAVRCVDGVLRRAAQYHLRKKQPPKTFEGEMRIMRLFTKAPVKTPVEEVPA